MATAILGFGSEVRHLIDQFQPDLVAVVDLGGPAMRPLAEFEPCLAERRTNREPFTGQRVPAQIRALLDLSAWAEGAKLQWFDRPTHRWWLRMATNEAVTADDEDQARTAERRRWVGGHREVDGVPSSALGPRIAGGETVVRGLAATDVDAARPVADFEREPQLAVLATRYDGPIEWLRAGQALEYVLLEATAHGVSVSLLNQVIEHEELRTQVNDPLSPWQRPQAVIRFGYGHLFHRLPAARSTTSGSTTRWADRTGQVVREVGTLGPDRGSDGRTNLEVQGKPARRKRTPGQVAGSHEIRRHQDGSSPVSRSPASSRIVG